MKYEYEYTCNLIFSESDNYILKKLSKMVLNHGTNNPFFRIHLKKKFEKYT